MHASFFTIAAGESRWLRWALALAHLLALAATLLADPPGLLRSALLAALAASAAFSLRHRPGASFRCFPTGEMEILRDGEWRPAALLPESVVTPTLTVLRYRTAGQRWAESRVILADSLAAADFRRLRVWLKWCAGKRVDTAGVSGADGSPLS